jgi:hypothetical protein
MSDLPARQSCDDLWVGLVAVMGFAGQLFFDGRSSVSDFDTGDQIVVTCQGNMAEATV